MKENQLALLHRLESYSPDLEGVSFPFSAKLAKENGWSSSYTRRVIQEYKRFCFLAMEAGHPVSPSETVDQAWHMHMLYTHEYWKHFCPEVLGGPFHHGPSRGGQKEHCKFDDWYRRTLESYQAFFGEMPPEDIWPSPKKRARHHFQRIDRMTHWVIPKPKWNPTSAAALSSLLLGLVAIGCTGESTGINPFNWYGPDFLAFYPLVVIPSWIAALWMRNQLRLPDTGPTNPNLGAYELAYLNGGKVLALNTALAGLTARKLVVVDSKSRSLVGTQPDLPNGHPIEQKVVIAN